MVVVAVLAVAVGAVGPGGAAPAQAQDPSADQSDVPVGFTDGIPVGGEETMGVPVPDDEVTDAGTDAAVAPRAFAAAAAVTPRYFGDGPWEAIRVAAVGVNKACSVSVEPQRPV